MSPCASRRAIDYENDEGKEGVAIKLQFTFRRRFGPLAASLAALVLAAPGQAFSAGGDGAPGPQVAPGVFLADGSELAEAGAPGKASLRAKSPRIVGGADTTIAQWPWQAAITLDPSAFAGSGFQRQFCGGSVVAPTLIVTAAHCFYSQSGGFTDPDDYAAITGRTQLSSNEGQEIPFADYHVPVDGGGNPLYNHSTSEWDVVLVELAAPSGSQPIMLAGADEGEVWAAGRDAFVTGWGRTGENGPRADILRVAQIAMLDDFACGSPRAYGPGFVAPVMSCAGNLLGGVDACQGDSGGPLVVPLAGGGFRLIGDTSFGFGCAQQGFPGVYGRLAGDPMRTTLANMAMTVAGANIVGSGAQPAPQLPPDTGILSGPGDRPGGGHRPRAKGGGHKAKFSFEASKSGASFECKLDKRQFKPCDSPEKYKVGKGQHKFQVVASAFGVTDPTPAKDRWRAK